MICNVLYLHATQIAYLYSAFNFDRLIASIRDAIRRVELGECATFANFSN